MIFKFPTQHFRNGYSIKIALSVSIISALLFAALNLYVIVAAGDILDTVDKSSWFETRLYFIRESIIVNLRNGGRLLYVLSLFFHLTLIFGCLRMWIGRIWGLLFYSVSKVALIIMPMFFFGEGAIASGDIMLAMFFLSFYTIYIYRRKYKID